MIHPADRRAGAKGERITARGQFRVWEVPSLNLSEYRAFALTIRAPKRRDQTSAGPDDANHPSPLTTNHH